MPSRKEANPPAAHTLTCALQLLGTHSTSFSERSTTRRGCGASGGRDVAPSVSLHTPPHSSSRCPPSSGGSVTGYHACRQAEGNNLRDLLQQQKEIVGLNAGTGEEESWSMTHLILWLPWSGKVCGLSLLLTLAHRQSRLHQPHGLPGTPQFPRR